MAADLVKAVVALGTLHVVFCPGLLTSIQWAFGGGSSGPLHGFSHTFFPCRTHLVLLLFCFSHRKEVSSHMPTLQL
jgi:hypothetical protein